MNKQSKRAPARGRLAAAGLFVGLILLGLTACSGSPPVSTSQPATTAPQVPAESGPVAISATGRGVPAEWTLLSFAVPGRVVEINVQTGDQVQAGEVLARLDSTELELAVARAQAALAQAEANLARVQAGAAPEEIAAAEWALVAAQARVAAAAAQRSALYSGVTEADLAAARSDLYAAEVQRNEALRRLEELQRLDPEDCAVYEEEVTVPATVDPGDLPPELAGLAGGLLGVQIPGAGVIATDPADAEILADQYRNSACPLGQYQTVEEYYELATLGVEAAQAYLDLLLAGPSPELVAIENARVWAASTQVEAARARLDYLLALPFPEEVAVAEANVAQAAAGLQAAEALLAQAVLVAPFDGVVTGLLLDAFELAVPGQPVVQLADLSHLQVETTDLNEIEVVSIRVGSPARVTFDALPGVEVAGTVASISPRVEEGPGVNYTTVIDLIDPPAALRWGMTASVSIEVGQQ